MSKNSIIQMTPVTSSQIESIGHDPETNTLAIRFARGGSLYHYRNFTAEQFQELSEAPSVGSFFYKQIKGNADAYPYTKINEDEDEDEDAQA